MAGGIEVIAEAANEGMTVALTRENAPDVVLMDIYMVASEGLDNG